MSEQKKSLVFTRKRKEPANEAPEHRTAPSSRCAGLKLSKSLLTYFVILTKTSMLIFFPGTVSVRAASNFPNGMNTVFCILYFVFSQTVRDDHLDWVLPVFRSLAYSLRSNNGSPKFTATDSCISLL